MNRRNLLATTAALAGAAVVTAAVAASPKPVVRTGYAKVNGLDMYYEIHGADDGTPLVLLHGAFSATGTSFGEMLPELAKSRKVISFELQGHGHTADIDRPFSLPAFSDDVAAALDQLNVGKADVFGYSLGAGVAMHLVLRRSDLVQKLIMASVTYNHTGFAPGFVEAMRALTPESLMGTPWQQEYAAIAPHPENFPGLVKKITAMMQDVPEISEESLSAVKAPTLLIAGDADNAPPEHTIALYRLLGGMVPVEPMGTARSWLTILPGTSHAFVPSRGEILNPILRRFLETPFSPAT